MRENGVPSISATCETCQHEAVLSADQWPPVPDIGLKLRFSACGGREIATRPNWPNPRRLVSDLRLEPSDLWRDPGMAAAVPKLLRGPSPLPDRDSSAADRVASLVGAA